MTKIRHQTGKNRSERAVKFIFLSYDFFLHRDWINYKFARNRGIRAYGANVQKRARGDCLNLKLGTSTESAFHVVSQVNMIVKVQPLDR